MGCGGTYFISCKDIIEKTSIQHGKLFLRLGEEITLDFSSGHSCDKCDRILNDKECLIFNKLSDPEFITEVETKFDCASLEKLVYIAGYCMKNYVIDHDEATYDYYHKYGDYLNEMNRGGLKKPDDVIVQWAIICYFLFLNVCKPELCRKSLSDYFIKLSDIHDLKIFKPQCYTLSNILLSQYCKAETPRSNKEVGQKALKLKKTV